MQARHATPPAFTPTAARAADQLDRRLSAGARSLLASVRAKQLRELDAEIDALELDVTEEMAAAPTSPKCRALRSLLSSAKALRAAVTGEGVQ
jgi:hypothetical protein